MTQMIWGLGKVEANFEDAERCILRVLETCPQGRLLQKFTSGLAKLQALKDAAAELAAARIEAQPTKEASKQPKGK